MSRLVSRWLMGDGAVLTPPQRVTHTHVIGQPNMGKSFALESWVMQDILAGHGVGVIDVHGDLFHHLVDRIALLSVADPQLAERVVIVDPSDRTWTVVFNPLETMPGISRERLAWFLTDVIVKIWNINVSEAPRMMRLLTNTFLSLSELGLSLVDLPRFLLDREWRDTLVGHTRYPAVADYFHHEFPRSGGAIHQWVTPVLNKIGPLIFDPDVRLMLATGSTINFRKILDRNLILLVNLSKGILAEGNSAMLGAFIMAHLQQAALSRANSRQREQFFLYLDEFQNYTTDNIKDILSESRKYGLSLVLAHQYLDQLPDDLRGAVLNTTGTICCFRVGYHDASVLAKEIFPPDYLQDAYSPLRVTRLGRYLSSLVHGDGQAHTQEALASLITQLKEREFWVKRRGPSQPIKQRSIDMPVPTLSRELHIARKQLITTVSQRYGKLKAEVRKRYNHEHRDYANQSTTYYEKA